jgi:hypothetical protein
MNGANNGTIMQALAIRFVHPSNGLRVRAIAQSSPSREIVMAGAGVSPGPHCAHIKTKTGVGTQF